MHWSQESTGGRERRLPHALSIKRADLTVRPAASNGRRQRHDIPFSFIVLLSLFYGCRYVPSATSATLNARPPQVSASVVGGPESVFDTKDACEQIDIPDAFPRAFRDYENKVHLIATHFVARAMVGPNLNTVKRDCSVIFRSPRDPDPSHFLDANWLDSLYTEDGRKVAALVHSEYHGDEHPGMCGDLQNPNHSDDCAWTTVTYAESDDGGKTFHEPDPPANLVAGLPYPYDKFNRAAVQGYNSPTNILKQGNHYFAMINVWREYKEQRYGPCLIRTSDPYNPSSWRAWDGRSFTIRFVNPYVERGIDPARHVCFPVVEGTIDSLAVDEKTGMIIADAYVEDDRYGQGPGFYLFASRDLMHWSKPTLVASTNALLQAEPQGHWNYLYFALLDPDSTERNFATISNQPYVYYVRLDQDHPPYTRVLFRRRIKISISAK